MLGSHPGNEGTQRTALLKEEVAPAPNPGHWLALTSVSLTQGSSLLPQVASAATGVSCATQHCHLVAEAVPRCKKQVVGSHFHS